MSGSSSYVKVSDNNWMSQYAQEMTISLWAYADDWSTETDGGRIFSCTESGGFNTEAGASGYLQFSHYVATNSGRTTHGYQYNNQGINLSELTAGWHMFTFVYNLSGEKIYVDGELHSQKTATSYGLKFNTNARLFLGCEASTANPSSPYFNGKMSDFKLFYTALSDDDIAKLYSTSSLIDLHGNVFASSYVEE